MSVKWIKLSVGMFDDEKIKLIEQMPDADTILIIWVKLLAQAGRTNASGYIYLSENIPYTDEMLAAIFNRPIGTVRMALKVFMQFGMIEIDEENFINISNWEKHQNVESLDRIREQTRQRVARYRERKMLEEPTKDSNATCNVTGNGHVTDIEEEREEEKEIVPFVEIVNYLNHVTGSNFRHTTRKTKDLINARWNEGFRFDDFKQVIDTKSEEWLSHPDMSAYLRPTTLFGTKFEAYLNQKKKSVGPTTPKYQELGDREY